MYFNWIRGPNFKILEAFPSLKESLRKLRKAGDEKLYAEMISCQKSTQ
jgi:hypothetical protein